MKKNVYPEIEFKEFTLKNGLKVVMSDKQGIPNVTVNTSFHVGSKDEEDGKSGLAHLFEHLMFVESPNVPKGMFDRILNTNGGDSNAFTTWDYTGYHITLPSNKLELALWLDSDRIYGFNISEESLEIQKNVVTEENLQIHENVPYGSVEKESSERLFDFKGYKRPIIGFMDDIRNTSIEDIRNFFYKYYTPGNAVLSIVGDIDYDTTAELVDKYYSEISPGPEIKREQFLDKKITCEIKDSILDNIDVPAIFIYYKTPALGEEDYYRLKVLSSVLSDGDSSRFYKELLYRKKLVSEIDSYSYGMEYAGLFSINAFAMKECTLETIEQEIDKILENIKNGKIQKDELLKVKNILETSHLSKRQSMNYLADNFSFYKLFFDDSNRINTEVNSFLGVGINDLISVANKYLNKENRVVLNYLPKKNGK